MISQEESEKINIVAKRIVKEAFEEAARATGITVEEFVKWWANPRREKHP